MKNCGARCHLAPHKSSEPEKGTAVEAESKFDALTTLARDGWRRVRDWFADQFAPDDARVGERELVRTFFRIGATGFGGGVAIIAQIRRVVVRQRQWLNEEEFLDAVSLAQSLPGANAANAIAYVGLKLGGIRGALAAVSSFVLPSFLIMIALTIAHGQLKSFPDAQRVFQGFNAAVVGLIAATTVRLGKTAMQQQWHLELGVAAGFMLIFTEMTVVEVVLLAGIINIFVQSYNHRIKQRVRRRLRKDRQTSVRSIAAEQKARQSAAELIDNVEPADALAEDHKVETALPVKEVEPHSEPEKREAAPEPAAAAGPEKPRGASGRLNPQTNSRLNAWVPLWLLLPLIAWPVVTKLVTVWQLVTIFLRVGTITFGGGFVMIPQIENDVVSVHRWMDHQTFADGMAFGQLTPGPVLITATFVGYKVAGLLGAIATTIAAFLPSFVMTIIAGTSLNRFRTNFQVQSFIAGVAPAVVGMLAAACFSLARAGLNTKLSYAVATLAFLLMLRAKLNPVVIMFGCGLLQWAVARGVINWLHL